MSRGSDQSRDLWVARRSQTMEWAKVSYEPMLKDFIGM